MTILQQMAAFTYGLNYRELPADVRHAARRHLADSVACMLGASQMDAVNATRSYALAQGGNQDATLIGAANKTPAALAALVNGTAVRYLDANDIVARSGDHDSGHFSDALPALLALAERHARSGAELLTCIVAAYELQGALSESFQFMKRRLPRAHPSPLDAANRSLAAYRRARQRRPSRRRAFRQYGNDIQHLAQAHIPHPDDKSRVSRPCLPARRRIRRPRRRRRNRPPRRA